MATEVNASPDDPRDPVSRRNFLKTSAVAVAAPWVGGCATTGATRAGPGILHAEHKYERIRLGVIGCGGRGTDAAIDCVRSSPGVEIVALGDLFKDHLDESRKMLTEPEDEKLADVPEKVHLTDDRCFVGFDAYQQVLALSEVDMVILATPPGFRPLHLRAAVDAGKHIFMEKPVAVDPIGVRSVIESADAAARKGLAIVSGTQRRHEPGYLATMQRIHDGAIGDIVGGQCYWNQGELWVKDRQPDWSDMEWQVRNWLYFTWLSGDHIVEQHVHNIDVINWAIGSPPVKAVGLGGRQVRTDPKFGNIYDHFAVEYEYANGVRVLSLCRQIPGTSERVSERLVGTHGVADPSGWITGRRPFKFETKGEAVNPYVQEHTDLVASIRRGKPLNEGRRIAESTLTAIMGRISAYTGREIQWPWVRQASQLDLTPPKYEFCDLPVDPVATPGETKLV